MLTAIAAYIGAYASEKGKRRAAREDSAQIRDELAGTTQALKEIEAKITGREWHRQWLLQQKRDVYAEAIQTLYHMHSATNLLNKALATQDNKKADDCITELEQLAPSVRKAQSLVAIIGSPEALDALVKASTAFPFGNEIRQRAALALENLRLGINAFEVAVRAEFGIDFHPSNDL